MIVTNSYKTRFIAFEGMDGCGKSTQLELASHEWPDFKTVKEPNKDLPSGKLIYGLLFGKHYIAFSQMSQRERQRYYFINRMEHYQGVLIPYLSSKYSVFSDRSLVSVCLDVQRPGDLATLLTDEAEFFEMGKVPFIWPDLTLIYDIPVEIALERLAKKSEQKRDFFEQKDRILQTKDAYLEFAKKFSATCRVISADEDAQTVYTKPNGTRDRIQRHLEAWPFLSPR